LLAEIKRDFFNGSRPPQMGLYQENLSCQGPNAAGGLFLVQEQNNTYTMMQALQAWINPTITPGAPDACLATTTPGDRSTAVSGPEEGIRHGYQLFGCRYFEIYLQDLLHPGFADEFAQWSNLLNTP
ncbi:MAG: hypothetical protein ACREBC_33025, partial [Pyrinomonadaceae bacterium]